MSYAVSGDGRRSRSIAPDPVRSGDGPRAQDPPLGRQPVARYPLIRSPVPVPVPAIEDGGNRPFWGQQTGGEDWIEPIPSVWGWDGAPVSSVGLLLVAGYPLIRPGGTHTRLGARKGRHGAFLGFDPWSRRPDLDLEGDRPLYQPKIPISSSLIGRPLFDSRTLRRESGTNIR